VICPRCATENPDRAKFCLECAAPLTPATGEREERKVVSVLFADLVGFTSRAEKLDPEEVRRVLQPYHALLRRELERHGGTVEKFIGDAVMAVFGAPVAREDDPERAVRAAIAIRDALTGSGLNVRIGVTTGEALVSLDAKPDAGEGIVAGDVVNTASRLQAAAPVDGVLVDEMTRQATDETIEYADHQPVAAKGKESPVAAWRAIQARARYGLDVRQHGAAALVGRDAELGLLVDALTRARVDREPQLVTLVGVPGIGKSRLVWELFQRVEAEPELIRWRQGRSLPYAQGVSLWAFGEMVKAEAGILDTDDEEAAGDKLRRAVAAIVPEANEARWVETHLRPLVGVGGAIELRTAERAERFAAWRRFLEAAAEQHPLVLVFEDLHWADDDLLDFVDHIVDWGRGVPLLVLATARPELLARRPGWAGGKANAVTRSLGALSEDDTGRLVRALLGRNLLDVDLEATLLERAGGNPLYAEEMARFVAEGRRLDDLPATLQGAIAARIDALPSDQKSLLQAAAVVGKVFWLGAVAAIAGLARWDVEEALHDLERKEFVRRERQSSVASESEYAFRHLLVRDVAYGEIPWARRAEPHRLAAEWIESLGRPEDHAEMLAHHYLSALEYLRATAEDAAPIAEAAGRALEAAGQRAYSLNAWAAAVRHYRAALELTPADDHAHTRLMLGLGQALHAAVDPEAESVLEDVASAGERSLEEAAVAEGLLANLWWYRGRRQDAMQHIERARELLRDGPETPARAAVLSELSRLLMIHRDDEEALAIGREALAIAERLGLDDIRAAALDNVGVARVALGDVAGRQDLERAIEIGLATSLREAGRAHNNLGFMNFEMGDVRADRVERTKSRRVAERAGDTAQLQFLWGAEMILGHQLGDWEDALGNATRILEGASSGAGHYFEGVALAVRAMIRFARGDEAGAEADMHAALPLVHQAGDAQMIVPTLDVRLRIDWDEGRRADASATARELLAMLTPRPARLDALIGLALVAPELDIVDEVRSIIGRVRIPSRWLAAASLILDGRLTQAADLLAEIGDLQYEARVRMLASRRLRDAGKHVEADEQLERARAFWRSVGATRYLAVAEGVRSVAS
jgi:class 3 adenylate cyclase/tetratricopeptide (TPR) repeat protein